MLITHKFTEILLPYSPAVREAWIRGDKCLIPPGHPRPRDIETQENYHFPEFFVLDHYRRAEGWGGYRWFVLCVLEDRGTDKYGPGAVELEKRVPLERLLAFRKARSIDPLERYKGKGEPDLFLFRSDGAILFIETKMADDVDEYQLRCLAQIRSILGVSAEIVRIVPEGKRATDKTHSIEIDVPPPVSARAPIRRPR